MNPRVFIMAGLLGLGVLTAAGPSAATYIGGSLSIPNPDIDGNPPFVILGQWEQSNTVTPSTTMAIPFTGTIDQIDFFGDGYDFTVFTLKLTASTSGELTFKIDGEQAFDGYFNTGGVEHIPADIPATAGDFIAYLGIGPNYTPYTTLDYPGSDAVYEDTDNPGSSIATLPGPVGTVFTVTASGGGSRYELIDDFGNQGRNYTFGVDEVAVPEPATWTLASLGLGAVGALLRRRRGLAIA
jgi:hypothetical protein